MNNSKSKKYWKYRFIDESNENNYDFHITPVLTFAKANIENEFGSGYGYGIYLDWGHWAIGVMRIIYKFK